MSVRRVPVPTAGVDGGPTAPGAGPSRLEQYLQSVLAAGARERARAAKAAPSADPKPADDAPKPADAPKATEPADAPKPTDTAGSAAGGFCPEFQVENDPAIRNADTAALALFRAAVTEKMRADSKKTQAQVARVIARWAADFFDLKYMYHGTARTASELVRAQSDPWFQTMPDFVHFKDMANFMGLGPDSGLDVDKLITCLCKMCYVDVVLATKLPANAWKRQNQEGDDAFNLREGFMGGLAAADGWHTEEPFDRDALRRRKEVYDRFEQWGLGRGPFGPGADRVLHRFGADTCRLQSAGGVAALTAEQLVWVGLYLSYRLGVRSVAYEAPKANPIMMPWSDTPLPDIGTTFLDAYEHGGWTHQNTLTMGFAPFSAVPIEHCFQGRPFRRTVEAARQAANQSDWCDMATAEDAVFEGEENAAVRFWPPADVPSPGARSVADEDFEDAWSDYDDEW